MRRSSTSRVAGNCCCLIPALILLAIFVAALIGVAVVWQAAVPDVFRWDQRHRREYYYDVYREGFEEGKRLGALYARRGDPAPADLEAFAAHEADRLNIRRDRERWTQGFQEGFTRGFRNSSNEASNEAASSSRLGAQRYLSLNLA